MNEYHVCGVLLMSRPEHCGHGCRDALSDMPGVELHANEGGRMVVTVEGDEYRHCADTITELADPGRGGIVVSRLPPDRKPKNLPEEPVQ